MSSDKSLKNESVGEWVDISILVENPRNPRVNDQAVESVVKSIKRFGFSSPIIARRANNMIIAGHTRYKASIKLGLSTVPVRYLDLDPADADLLMIADNKIGEKADWNNDLLSEILTEINGFGLELDALGFTDEELSNLIDSLDVLDNNDTPVDQEDIAESREQIASDCKFTLLEGNNLHTLKSLPDNSIDAIVTDPPYELGFMGKGWDRSGIAYNVDLWKECYRVLKYGGHMVAFSGSRTIFPMGTAILEAGFEIRDSITWIYTSGFPKSLDISKGIDKKLGVYEDRKIIGTQKLTCTARGNNGFKTTSAEDGYNADRDKINITAPASAEAKKWQGWGTGLKPAQEPAILARKPIDPLCKNVTENVLKWGTGAINIDKSRMAYGDDCWFGDTEKWERNKIYRTGKTGNNIHISRDAYMNDGISIPNENGRFPANVYHCKKASRKEREAGLEHLNARSGAEAVNRKKGSAGINNARAGAGRTADKVKNFHPTVKPIKLMRWLCSLLCQEGGTVLDIFLGSGTTAVAGILEGYNVIGCEITPDYYPIIHGRVEWAKKIREENKQDDLDLDSDDEDLEEIEEDDLDE